MNRRSMFKHLGAIALLASSGVASVARAADPTYSTLSNKLPGDAPGKVEIIEFFHYGCPHCRNFDPLLHSWLQTIPEDVAFRRIPAIWGNAQLRELARLYFTIETTGNIDKLHEEVFVAVQEKKLPLSTEEGVREWLTGFDVDAEAFMATYKSFGLEAQLKRADQLAKNYGIRGVPTMAVGGHYLTSASMTGSHENTLKVVDDLIVKARAEIDG